MFCLWIGWLFKMTDVLFANKSSLWGDWLGACKQVMHRLHMCRLFNVIDESALWSDWWVSSLKWLTFMKKSNWRWLMRHFWTTQLFDVTDVSFAYEPSLMRLISQLFEMIDTQLVRGSTQHWLLCHFWTNHLFDVTNESIASESIAWLSSLMW